MKQNQGSAAEALTIAACCWRMSARTGIETTDDMAALVGRRHAQPDACHHSLDSERVGDGKGQQAARPSSPKKFSQA